MPLGPMGHVYDWRSTEQYLAESPRPLFAASASSLADSGAGKKALLHLAVKEITGGFVHIDQTVGDCTSMGGYKVTDYLKCVEIKNGEREEFVAMTASEPIYAYARVEVARNIFSGGDGCNGASIVKALQAGTLLRQRYSANGTLYDFTTYSGQKARDWGQRNHGVPDDLEPTMREHSVRSASLVTSYEELRDAIYNGYPALICSNQGFSDTRDSEGFAKPSGSWSHCMTAIAMDDDPKRPGILIDNSWPVGWISGPTRWDQPPGSFWVDANVIEKRMLRPQPDSFVVSGYNGYPSRDLFEQI